MSRVSLILLFVIAWAVLPIGAVLRRLGQAPSVDIKNSVQLKAAINVTHVQSEHHFQFHEAVVVTLHKLTRNVRQLLSSLYRSLAGGKRALWVLVDKKRATPTMLHIIGNCIRHRERVVTISYQMMLHKVFPNPTWAQKRAFDTFEGIHQAPAKPGALWFLAEGPGSWYDHVWVLESDVVLHKGNWAHFFNQYSGRRSDLVSVIDNPKRWSHWRTCNHPGCKKVHVRQRSFLPVFRVSRRLATDVLESLRSGYAGHHEAFLYTVCKEERRWHCVAEDLKHSPSYGYISWKKTLPRRLTPGKIYHPVRAA